MDIMVEFLLFVCNIKSYFYICPFCNCPILYIIEKEEPNNIIINDNDKNNENNDDNYKMNDFDCCLFKSINLCSELNELFFTDFKSGNIIDYKKKYKLNNLEQKYIPANPPKKVGSVNIIYHDENHKIFQDSINKDAIKFKEASNGTFIFSSSMAILETIMNEIYQKNSQNVINKFLLITTGSTFEKVMNFLNEKQYTSLISKACIYCLHKENYLSLKDKYDLLGGIFNVPSSVVEFIENNLSEENNVFQYSKLVSYDNYISKYFKLHKTISEYYANYFKKTFDVAIELLKEILDKNSLCDKELIQSLEVYKNKEDYEVLREYTKDILYPYINKWLLNLDTLAYKKAGYFIGGLMYKLNEYGEKKEKGNKNKCTLYRGLYLNYLDALSYQIYNGKIICFQTFLSTSLKQGTALFYSRKERTTLEDRKRKCMFSTFFTIEHNWDKKLFPLCFDISDISQYKNEKELLFHPYSFFKIKKFDIDLENYILNLELETIGKKEILEYCINDGKRIILNEKENIMEAKK